MIEIVVRGESQITYGFEPIGDTKEVERTICELVHKGIFGDYDIPNNSPIQLFGKPVALLRYVNYGKPGHATGGIIPLDSSSSPANIQS